MIGTIRKHSTWLWWFIAAATIISFVWWGASVPSRGGGGGGAATGDYGSIYGQKVTEQEYADARSDFYIYYWFHNGFQWPAQNPNLTPLQLDQQTYLRVMLMRKAHKLGIYVDENTTEVHANNLLSDPELLQAAHVQGQSIPIDAFVKQILEPQNFTVDDFERFSRDDLIMDQLIGTIGMAGELFTPQEASIAWHREHQERETEVVFFSATNYLSQIPVTPGAVGQFYTNYMAYYRLPDRVQVSYVEFNVTNYFAAAEKEIGSTNLDYQVNSAFAQYGIAGIPGAKTPDEAKALIRNAIIRKRAMTDANSDATDFANAVFSQTPATAGSLALVAKQKGLRVKTPAPFSEQYGPSEFIAPEAFTKAAFSLSPDDLFAGPVQGTYADYVMVLDQQLPTEIPPLSRISDQVARDYQTQVGIDLARRDGTNFVTTLNLKLVLGRTFAAACVAAGFTPEDLPPFSLSTQDLPELQNRAGLPQIKQAAFGTAIGHASDFEPTDTGGFIIYPEKELPADETAMKTEMPQYLDQVRQQQANELFQGWVNAEANRELINIPALAQMAQQKAQ